MGTAPVDNLFPGSANYQYHMGMGAALVDNLFPWSANYQYHIQYHISVLIDTCSAASVFWCTWQIFFQQLIEYKLNSQCCFIHKNCLMREKKYLICKTICTFCYIYNTIMLCDIHTLKYKESRVIWQVYSEFERNSIQKLLLKHLAKTALPNLTLTHMSWIAIPYSVLPA